MVNTKNEKRYAVVSRTTMKALKNAGTRNEAREWKRNSGKSGLAILDRQTSSLIS